MTAQAQKQGEWLLFAGSYGSPDGERIKVLRFSAGDGTLTEAGGISGIENPSYLAFDRGRGVLYSVVETDDGSVVALRFDRAGIALEEIARQPADGAATCHVAVDPAHPRVHVANYSSGSYTVLPLDAGGGVLPLTDRAQHEGRSVDPLRQNEPHVHAVFPEPGGSCQLVCDLGLDKVFVYRTNPDGKLAVLGEIRTPAGTGPRHLAFHPSARFLYVLGEMGNEVHAYAYEDGEIAKAELRQSVSTLPADFVGTSTTAAIKFHPSGRWLYASNRGSDSIAVFEVGGDGLLTQRAVVPTGGRTPRDFAVLPDGSHLIAANQDSDTIVVFRIGEDGVPASTGATLVMEKPVCLVPEPA